MRSQILKNGSPGLLSQYSTSETSLPQVIPILSQYDALLSLRESEDVNDDLKGLLQSDETYIIFS